MSWTQEEIAETVAKVVARSQTDAAFRQLSISNINRAVKEISGKEIPEGFRINVIDGAGYHANIVLPEAKSSVDELSETELESIAGGSKESLPDGIFWEQRIPTNPGPILIPTNPGPFPPNLPKL